MKKDQRQARRTMMTSHRSIPRSIGFVLLMTGCWVTAAAGQGTPPAAAKPTAAAAAAAGAGQGSEYVPNSTCATCHQEEFDQYGTSPHAKIPLSSLGERSQPGCQSCHGPGKNHTDNPGDPTTILSFKTAKAAAVNERCLSCHSTSHEQQDFTASVHSRNHVACTDCHSVHHPKVEQALLRLPQPQLCYTCHIEKKTEFNMPSHHKVNEGLVQCSDCHNPHAPQTVRTSAAADAVCYTCHSDKRGPFVFNHEPVKVDGCLACHNPHGTANPHLLKVANVNILCLQCHTTASFSSAPGIPSFHNQGEAQYQSCLSCHTMIHGSNFSPYFFY